MQRPNDPDTSWLQFVVRHDPKLAERHAESATTERRDAETKQESKTPDLLRALFGWMC